MSSTFRMSTSIDHLRVNLVRYREWLLKSAPRMQVHTASDNGPIVDPDYKRINRRGPNNDISPAAQAIVSRVNEALSKAELYEPVHLDQRLVTDRELAGVKHPRTM